MSVVMPVYSDPSPHSSIYTMYISALDHALRYTYAMARTTQKSLLQQLTKSLPIVIGLVLVWRGIWYVADSIDLLFFNGSHMATAIGGIVFGILLLYLPDRNLKEIEKL